VTGTRGKSTVTRFIAAALRESGFTVLGKATGSRPVIILPDGREEEIARKGLPSILEGKKVLKQGVSLGVGAIVTELMSIRPEAGQVESRRILRPGILVITNVRVDHREEMGWTKPEVAQSLASAIPEAATVFLPDEELYPEFERTAAKLKSRIVLVKKRETGERGESQALPSMLFFEENLRLALAVSRHLGISDEIARRGLAKAQPDFGSLKIWSAELGTPPVSWLLVSAFAANDPESTGLVLARIKDELSVPGRKLIGVLNFRQDRGDRTLQWISAVEQAYFRDFSRLFFIGAHLRALRTRRKFNPPPVLTPLTATSPAAIMGEIGQEADGAVLVGMGNMGGLGAALVEHWEKIGRPYEP
jgi:poly-gamma-glutamate synthase PgsB/CapB